MYSSVVVRATEIVTLCAIGFSGFAVSVGTLIEWLALAAIGGGASIGPHVCIASEQELNVA